ncbi:ribonuclease R [Parasediminibacterium sp. JCM 36343]|uniref:ribonuclease R n=1 Tax=Parasediminibacterium sp. JCM 36343 TaxID=3374279 RepID=UPI0039789F44
MSKSTGSKKAKNKNGKKPSGGHNTVKGSLEITRSGMGYVVIEDKSGDVLVRPGDFNTALNGDIVRVRIIKENLTTKKKEGKITEVVTRKQTEFIGHIQLSTNFAFFVPDTDKPMPDLFIPLDKLKGAKNKDKVVARLVEWGKDDKKPVGEVVSLLVAGDSNDSAMKELLAEAGFPLSFSDEVMEEALRLPDVISEEEIKLRKDCRDILTFTIDPIDAKDFDDAISIRKLKNGSYEIGVHIADVSHYVKPGSLLDEEAYKRATSVYLPDRVNPMLPERISNELCSLRPNEDKCTFSAMFQLSAKGEVKQYWIGKTVIHSNHRFTYEDVQTIVETKEGPYKDEILLLNTIAQGFRKERFKSGAINFSSTEVRFKLDEKGKPIDIVVKESKESHQLVEEFMLLANKTVTESVFKAEETSGKPIPFPYRIHDQPDEKKLLPFMEYAKRYGHQFNTSTPEKIAQSFNQMLADVKGKPEQHVLEQLGIRTMAKAAYTTKNIGHYGLSFEYYCHFTSPIRRYPDVLVHRVIESILEGKPMHDKKMEEKCKHTSERERAAMECERSGNKYKQVEFMRAHLGQEFEGVISGVAGFGFFVETIDYKCEGMVSIISLSSVDEFFMVEGDYSLAGKRSGRKFKMGDKVWIKVVAANLEKRQLDYEWVNKPITIKEQPVVAVVPSVPVPPVQKKQVKNKPVKSVVAEVVPPVPVEAPLVVEKKAAKKVAAKPIDIVVPPVVPVEEKVKAKVTKKAVAKPKTAEVPVVEQAEKKAAKKSVAKPKIVEVPPVVEAVEKKVVKKAVGKTKKA